jgi:hypothetical protein
VAKVKKITPADRLAQQIYRLRRDLDAVLAEYMAATQEPEDGGPVRQVVDPLRKVST